MTPELQSGAVSAAVMPEPFSSGLEQAEGAVPLVDLNLDSYPVSTGPVGSVDKARLQRVVNVMQQFGNFPSFNIGSILIGGG